MMGHLLMKHKLSMDRFEIDQLPKLAKSRILSFLYRNCCGPDIKFWSNPEHRLNLSRCYKINSERFIEKAGKKLGRDSLSISKLLKFLKSFAPASQLSGACLAKQENQHRKRTQNPKTTAPWHEPWLGYRSLQTGLRHRQNGLQRLTALIVQR